MRTGKFSELTGLSKDTIYYYIDRGLIYPDRVNNRYSFNKKNLENVEIIKLYQDMDFSIDEIISIMSLWNWSNNTEENIKNELGIFKFIFSYSLFPTLIRLMARCSAILARRS